MTPRVGAPAPDLVLPDIHGTPVALHALRGTPVLLVFVPFAFSAVCTDELGALRDAHAALTAGGDGVPGVRVLAVSCDPMFALRAWTQQEGYPFDLLSDFWPHGAAARSYGVLDESAGHPRRGSFLVDAAGVLRWSLLNPAGRGRDVGEYRRALAELWGGPRR